MLGSAMYFNTRKRRPSGISLTGAPTVLQDQLLASHFDFTAVDFGEQVFPIIGHEVHDLELHRLGGGDGNALADRLFHPIGVAAPLPGQGAARGHHVVDQFFLHGLVDLTHADRDRVGRADVGPGRHGGHVRRHGDEDPGRGGPGAPGIDINDHRNFGVGDGLNDLAHGGFQTAGGVQFNHQGRGVLALRLADALHDEFRQPRVNGAYRRQHENRPGRGRTCRPGRQEQHQQRPYEMLKSLHGQPDTP